MRKVKNKKFIRRLADKSFQSNRARNRIAILAIALTTLLFTTLFTISLGAIESFQLATMRQAGGDSHGVFKNLTREQYEKLKAHPSIRESAPCILVADEIENPEFLKRHMEAWYYPAYHYKHCFVEILEGAAPKKANEILMDEVSMELLGLEAKPGQEVTLQMRLRGSDEKAVRRTFLVSGVTRADPALNVGFALVSDDYLTKHADELTYTYDKDFSATGAIRMDVNFANSLGIQKKLDKALTDCGYSTDETQENYIAANANWAYVSDGAEADPLTMAAIAVGLLLIFLTGYLIIYNVFQISVTKDIRYYGLLKTVGTTGRQMKMILRRQALTLSAFGIPLGIVTGFFIGKGIVPHILASTTYQGEAKVSFHPLILIGSALFSLLTVFTSIGKPSRMAAKVSPVEAVRYTDNAQPKKQPRQKKSLRGGRIFRMALANLARNKGRTAVAIASLSLAVILLNSVFTITNSFDLDKYLKKFVTSDFLIANARYFNSQYWGSTDNTIDQENLSESFIEACEAQDGFEKGGRIYGTATVAPEAASYQAPDHIKLNENGNPYRTWGKQQVEYAPDEQGAYRSASILYGLDDFPLGKIEVWKGEKDLDVIRQKLATGKYILSGVQVDDNDVPMPETAMHLPGDSVTMVQADGARRTFEVLSLVKINYYGLSCRMGLMFNYYTTSDVFLEMASPRYLMSYAFNVEDKKEEDFVQFVKQYTDVQEPLMSFESKQTYLKEFSKMTGLFVLIGGVLTIVIGLIGILNFINTILTGIVSRKKEFAMMEAIGMTAAQRTRMLMLEGLYYAGITIAVSLLAGSLFSLTAVRAMAGGMWFMKYHFVIGPMLALFPALLILGAAIPYLAYLSQRRQTWMDYLADH